MAGKCGYQWECSYIGVVNKGYVDGNPGIDYTMLLNDATVVPYYTVVTYYSIPIS